jgi:hypothetical protein
MLFNAAKDLVYTVDGNKITSGGYRINKILGSNTTKKGQKGGKKHSSEKTDFFNEDSGIPVGLLLLQSQHKYLIRSPSKSVDKSQDNFVYIVNEDEHEDEGNNEELVIIPQSQSFMSSSSLPSPLENSIHISSNEIDDDLYDVLLKNASYSESESGSAVKKNKGSTKKRHFGAHVEKVFQKRKTRSKRRV